MTEIRNRYWKKWSVTVASWLRDRTVYGVLLDQEFIRRWSIRASSHESVCKQITFTVFVCVCVGGWVGGFGYVGTIAIGETAISLVQTRVVCVYRMSASVILTTTGSKGSISFGCVHVVTGTWSIRQQRLLGHERSWFVIGTVEFRARVSWWSDTLTFLAILQREDYSHSGHFVWIRTHVVLRHARILFNGILCYQLMVQNIFSQCSCSDSVTSDEM